MRKTLLILAVMLAGTAVMKAAPGLSLLDTLRVPCVLVEFRDVQFVSPDPQRYFDRLLNEEGFSERNATGSVRDFYADNSLGAFIPVFDVLGPVRLDKYRAYYGRDEIRDGVRADAMADLALVEACKKLDPDTDFSVYDADEDGILDVLMFIYAGHDQSQGGPPEAIWAHQWWLSRSATQTLQETMLDGLLADVYCCAPELSGREGESLTGIGIVCHEFGHTLGLPDFYDLDTADGEAAADLGAYSTMCGGLFNNDGRTPPCFNAEERRILGWLDFDRLPELQPGPQQLASIRTGSAYRTPTGTEGEYFLYEFRDGTGWDAALPAGLVIYHVDRSERLTEGISAAARWENWREHGGINNLPGHPCFYIIPSALPIAPGNLVFPGLSRCYAYEPAGWDGNRTGWQITNIGLEAGRLNVFVQQDAGVNLNGYVRDVDGQAVSGATVRVQDSELWVLTQRDGYYRLDLPEELDRSIFTLQVSKDGWRPQLIDLSMDGKRVLSVPVTLRREGEADEATLSKYDRSATMGYYSKPGIGAVRFTPQDLAPYVGDVLSQVTFFPYLQRWFEGDIWLTVDIGGKRVLSRQVETPSYGLYFRNTVDISDAGIVIPEGEDIYIGYGSRSTDGFYVGTVYPGAPDNSYYAPFSLEVSEWKPMYVERAGLYMNVALSASVQEQAAASDLTELGYSYIQTTGDWCAGSVPEVRLVVPEGIPEPAVSWFLDGRPLDSETVPESGRHVLEAHVQWSASKTEILKKIIDIQ